MQLINVDSSGNDLYAPSLPFYLVFNNGAGEAPTPRRSISPKAASCPSRRRWRRWGFVRLGLMRRRRA
jgi:hypothetical protein